MKFDSNKQSVQSFIDKYRSGSLNLNPVFQRQSVWGRSQRQSLINSVFHGFPIPAVFLYKHIDETGKTIFEVVDGKQRLETLFMYTGTIRGKFSARVQLPNEDRPEDVDWQVLKKRRLQSRIEDYQLQVIEVEVDDLSDIIELFVRINSSGKALTKQEIRNARYYQSEFLGTAKKLATRYERYLQSIGTIAAQQVRRMKHVELMSELLYSAHIEGLANKKRVIDAAMRNDGLKGKHLKKAEAAAVASLNHVRRMFPELSRSVRFHKLSDFYSVTAVIQDLARRGFVLSDKRSNRLAWDLLIALGKGVDELSWRSKKLDFKSLTPQEELFAQYLQAVREGSDTEVNRRKRHDIICGLIEPVLDRKDTRRGFSPEQRRILWNSAEERVCVHEGCGHKLTWADFQADHIKPFTMGGKTELANAAILCAKHNASKGKKCRATAA